MLLTGDLGFGVFEEFEQKFPGQYLNCGIMEQSIIGIAAGFAHAGHTVIIWSISNFITLRCLEQIRNDACYHDLNITIIGSGGGFTYGALGMSHHATEDVGTLRTLPNIDIVAPATYEDVYGATLALAKKNRPGYLRLEKEEVRLLDPVPFEIGKAQICHEGSEYLVITTGGVLSEAITAAQMLTEQQIRPTICSLTTVKPVDPELATLLKTHQHVITVEEHNIVGGIGSAVAELIADNTISLTTFKRLGLQDTYSSIVGSQSHLRKTYGISAEAIAEVLIGIAASP